MDIIYLIKIIILAIVEGLTEFLPVSSTGHLIIAARVLDVPQDNFMQLFMILVQLAAILAVVLLFFKRIWRQFVALLKGNKVALHFWLKWILASVPFVVLAVLFDDIIEHYLMSPITVAASLFIGGLLLYFGEAYQVDNPKTMQLEQISYKQALGVGIWQCLALWPGFSRSASTIIGGWFVGLRTKMAAEFSFFLAMPLMVGASLYSGLKFYKHHLSGADNVAANLFEQAAGVPFIAKERAINLAASSTWQYFYLAVGCVVAFFVALVVVRAFMRYLAKNSLRKMALYRIGVAVLLALFYIAGWR